MTTRPRRPLPTALRRGAALLLATALLLAGCTTAKKEAAPAPEPPAAAAEPEAKPSAPVPTVRLITVQTPAVRAYRKLAARHLYEKHAKQIYKGRIPPLVHAVVVAETDLDAEGRVVAVHFSRTPSHAPDVAPKIEALIRAASPLPPPGRVGPHTYVDTWLWDRSGRFQLDTLTEGQRSR